MVLEYNKTHVGDTPWMGVWETAPQSLHSLSAPLFPFAPPLPRGLRCLLFAPERPLSPLCFPSHISTDPIVGTLSSSNPR